MWDISQFLFACVIITIYRNLGGLVWFVRFLGTAMHRPKKQYEEDYSDTVYPQEIATVALRAAIPARNMWMIDRAEYVVTYAYRHGGAVRWQQEAEKKGKTVVRLSDL